MLVTNCLTFSHKQSLDLVFVTSGVIKVEVSVLSRRRLSLIILTETVTVPDITKTESDSCFIIHCVKENNEKRIMLKKRINQPRSHFAVCKMYP